MSLVDKLLDPCEIKSRVRLTWHIHRSTGADLTGTKALGTFAARLAMSAMSMALKDCHFWHLSFLQGLNLAGDRTITIPLGGWNDNEDWSICFND
jgi:hypothetical protein